jgi:starvation-inducible DNA-binding protein
MNIMQERKEKYTILKPTTSKDRLFGGVSEPNRDHLSQCLTKVLANTYALYLKTQNLHWNATGPMFYSIHNLTEEQYKALAVAIDDIAERIRAIGFPTVASLEKYSQMSDIVELDLTKVSMESFLESLALDHDLMSKGLREAVKEADKVEDYKTSDLLTDRIGLHEQYAWMWRSMVSQ